MAGLPPERISRFLTYLLRHRPKEYPLVFDKRGFVDWQDIVEMLQERYYDVTEESIWKERLSNRRRSFTTARRETLPSRCSEAASNRATASMFT